MDFDIKTMDQGNVITVLQDLDLSRSRDFEKVLLEQAATGKSRLIVDLSAAQFIDSSGIQALVVGMKKMKETGGKIRLVLSNPAILRIFTMLSLNKVFAIFPTLEDALKQD